MEERRAGPLAQLMWDLSTLPSLRAAFVQDPGPILAERGLEAGVLPAIQGDQTLLAQFLTAEDAQLNGVFGARPQDNLCSLTFPPSENPAALTFPPTGGALLTFPPSGK